MWCIYLQVLLQTMMEQTIFYIYEVIFITDVYLTIYDRWGEKLFETNDVKKGWDGTFKGKQLDQGVYGYYMTFTCNNEEQSFKKGNITLTK